MISVIVPQYQNPKLIQETIDNLMLFISDPFELIIIDDWSNIETKAEIQRVLKRYKFIKLITHNKNLWITKSLNNWIKEAIWDYILCIHNDCRILTLQTIQEMKTQTHINCIVTPSYRINNWIQVYTPKEVQQFCFMFHKSNNPFPITTNFLSYNYNLRLHHRVWKDLWIAGIVNHIWSQTNNKKVLWSNIYDRNNQDEIKRNKLSILL